MRNIEPSKGGRQARRQHYLPISFVILYHKGDRQKLALCLESLPSGAEIVCCETIPVHNMDGRCSDSPGDLEKIGIAAKCKHYYKKGRFHYAAARNCAKKAASREIIFSIDPDEMLNPAQHGQIIEHCSGLLKEDECAALMVSVISESTAGASAQKSGIVLHREISGQARIFKNLPGLDWAGPVHETIAPSLEKAGLKFYDTSINITHSGYLIDTKDMIKKLDRRVKLFLTHSKETLSQKISYDLFLRDAGLLYNLKKSKV